MVQGRLQLQRCALFASLVVSVCPFSLQRPENDKLSVELRDIDLLWEGIDVEDGTESLLPASQFRMNSSVHSQGAHVFIMGMFDSGTNLLSQLIKRNFPSQSWAWLEYSDPPCPLCPVLWKHSNSGSEDLYRVFNLLQGEASRDGPGLDIMNSTILAVVRSPVSQVASWRKAPYDLVPCVYRRWSRMDSPCSAPLRASLAYVGRPRNDMSELRFDSTMDIYNQYIRQYKQLVTDGRFRHVKLLTYEEILYNPRELIRELATIFGVPAPRVIDIIEAPAKDHGHPHGRAAALQSYARRSWMNGVPNYVLRSICQTLDLNQISDITEGHTFPDDPERVPIPYTRDCSNIQ